MRGRSIFRALVHVTEMTQPQGHSTSGSHERYKSSARLEWERAHDCLLHMRAGLLEGGVLKEADLVKIEQRAELEAKEARNKAWRDFVSNHALDRDGLVGILEKGGKELKDLGAGDIREDIIRLQQEFLCIEAGFDVCGTANFVTHKAWGWFFGGCKGIVFMVIGGGR